MKKAKKILVTGANGQLGMCIRDLALKFSDLDFHFKTSKSLDIRLQDQVFALFEKEKFDYCINCAAYTAVDKAESDKENAFLVNAEAVKYLSEACKETNTTLIHISTDFVFDGTKEKPYTELDIPNPINVYGASKLKGEKYIREILEKFFIIRTSWVYSEHGYNFVKTMLKLGSEREELNIVSDQIGTPTYAGDLANVILSIIETNSSQYGLFHFTGEGEISWYDFAKEVFRLKEINIKTSPIGSEEYPTPANRPKYSVMDNSKIKQLLDVKTSYWGDSLSKCLGIFSSS